MDGNDLKMEVDSHDNNNSVDGETTNMDVDVKQEPKSQHTTPKKPKKSSKRKHESEDEEEEAYKSESPPDNDDDYEEDYKPDVSYYIHSDLLHFIFSEEESEEGFKKERKRKEG